MLPTFLRKRRCLPVLRQKEVVHRQQSYWCTTIKLQTRKSTSINELIDQIIKDVKVTDDKCSKPFLWIRRAKDVFDEINSSN